MCHKMVFFMYVCSAQIWFSRTDSTQPTMSQEDSSVFDALNKYGVAGRPLEKNEERVVGRLAEVAKVVLDEAAREIIRKAHKRLVLFE